MTGRVNSENDASGSPDEHEPFEVLLSGYGTGPGLFGSIAGNNTVFPGGSPDVETAERFLTGVVSRHHELVDAFADALRTDEAAIGTATSDLDESIMALSIARSLFTADVSESAADDDEVDLHSEWLHDNLDIEQSTPPEAEVPVSVELGIVLHGGEPLIRVRDALVYSSGFVLTIDAARRQSVDFTRDERIAFDGAMSEMAENVSVSPDQGVEASPHSGWSRVFHRSAVGWCEVWVEGDPVSGPLTFHMATPFPEIRDDLAFAIDADGIREARAHVIDLRPPS